MRLSTAPSAVAGDALFAALAAAQDGLDERRALVFTLRLVLLLANHVGRADVFEDALRLAAEPDESRCTPQLSPPAS